MSEQWKADKKRILFGDSAIDVNSEQTAAFIVQCVNSHEALVDALRYLVDKHEEGMTRAVTIDWGKAKAALEKARP